MPTADSLLPLAHTLTHTHENAHPAAAGRFTALHPVPAARATTVKAFILLLLRFSSDLCAAWHKYTYMHAYALTYPFRFTKNAKVHTHSHTPSTLIRTSANAVAFKLWLRSVWQHRLSSLALCFCYVEFRKLKLRASRHLQQAGLTAFSLFFS